MKMPGKFFWPGLKCGAAILLAGLFSLSLAVIYSPRPPLLGNAQFGKAIVDKDGRLMRLTLATDEKYRLHARISEISPYAVAAALRYEDQYFYSHPGVNIFAMLRALAANLLTGRRMGASTITMQVARLGMRLDSSTITGKLRQIFRALILERHYSKTSILEAYFNLAPYGGNIEGIEAAARIYFDQPAACLTEAEACALAIVPQNPAARNPATGKRFAEGRERLWDTLHPGEEMPPLQARSPSELPFVAPHLATELAAVSETGEIRTFISRANQNLIEERIRGFVERGRQAGVHNAAAMLVDSASMEVIALAGSAAFHKNAIQGQIDGTRARRSPGSTLKPFIYGLALDQGLIHTMSLLADAPKSFGGYDPQNFDRGFTGPVHAAPALRNSRNLPAINLAEQLGGVGLYGFLRDAGIILPREPGYYGLALTLGGAEISMRDLAALYAMLANKGIWQPLRFTAKQPAGQSHRLLSPEAAWLVLNMLRREEAYVMSRGVKIPLLYKTGTSNGMRDAWTCGLVGRYALMVWVGNFDNSANPLFVGAKTALPLFEEIAQALAVNERLDDQLGEPAPGLNVEKVEYCATTGDFDLAHCPVKGQAWIIPGVSPVRSRGILRPVHIDRTTGLRLCENLAGEDSEEVWMEFWPTEMLRIFRQAGVSKPAPPDWHPACAGFENRQGGKAPAIILPKRNIAYQRPLYSETLKVPLRASAEPDIKKIYWYAGNEFLGASAPGETIFWETSGTGTQMIRAVDDAGRGVFQKCEIEVAH